MSEQHERDFYHPDKRDCPVWGLIFVAILLAVCVAFFSPSAHAQTLACPQIDSTSAHVCWAAPTKMNDGTAIPAGTLITYTLYSGPQATIGAFPVATTTALEFVFIKLAKGDHCYAVTASVAGNPNPSALSTIACKTIRDPAPTQGSIEAPTQGSIEQR